MSYKPTNNYTKQSIIDKINNDFTIISLDKEGANCQYRGAGGAKCAVGVFIPEDEYRKSMENNSITVVLEKYPRLLEFMPLPLLALGELQHLHDRFSSNADNAGGLCRNKLVGWVEANVEDITMTPPDSQEV